jgi:glutamate formiminotransferase
MTAVPLKLLDEAMEAAAWVPDPVTLMAAYPHAAAQTCIGFVGNQQAFALVLVELANLNADVARALAAAVRTNQLGLRTIYYFPGFELAHE